MIKVVAVAFGKCNKRVVFVGGAAAIPFYLPEAYLSHARPTKDMDVGVAIVGRMASANNDHQPLAHDHLILINGIRKYK